jgi:hypothetical protein
VPLLTVADGHTITIDLSAVRWNGDYSALQTNITLQAVPEPGAVMLAAGLLGLDCARRRNR